ncbi:MAG: sulfate ABC transporter ATP-binding protein [Candidatus Tectomicrobia bacterium]|nr:sulfate ABC transporter ATP-binding protein [Candidatus Tectomicrobia bacterium]
MSIEVRHISKTFGAFMALEDISLTVGTGELVALLGPSGSGKTTLLRVIAGLESPDRGSVLVEGRDITDSNVRDRRVGFVFQHYALFRHMTVFENVAFGLRVKPRRQRPSARDIRDKVYKLLTLVRLEQMAERYPTQLSGGQRQRVALARALAVEPKILLLDEPFGALDAKVRQELRRWLRRLHDDIGITSVFVTHDQEEALELADRVVVMREGQVEQVGRPDEVYEHPATPFVYHFLGHVNVFDGRVGESTLDFGAFSLELPLRGLPDATAAVAYARPHLLDIDHRPTEPPQFRATVAYITTAGPLVKVELATEAGTVVYAEVSQERYRQLGLRRGDEVFVRVKDMRVFPQHHNGLRHGKRA